MSMVLAVVLQVLLFAGCAKEDEELVRRLGALESGDYTARAVSDERLSEIREGIRRYRAIVEERVRATDQLGVYYKMLAIAFLDRRMYGEALKALDEAILIHPESTSLYLFKGGAAGQLAQAVSDPVRKAALLATAEQAYLRCLQLDSTIAEAMYGLGILYAFELRRPTDAVSVLKRLVERETENMEAMFVLAGALLQTGDRDGAIELYDRIARTSKVETQRREARRNKQAVLDGGAR